MDGGSQDDGERRLLRRHTRRARLLDLADDVLHSFLNLFHGAALAGPAKVRDSLVDVQAVPRQLVGERHQLASERPAYPAQDREREESSHEDRRHPTEPSPLERAHDGTQEEREQDGQRKRDQHGLQPVQARNDQRDDPPRLVHVRSSADDARSGVSGLLPAPTSVSPAPTTEHEQHHQNDQQSFHGSSPPPGSLLPL